MVAAHAKIRIGQRIRFLTDPLGVLGCGRRTGTGDDRRFVHLDSAHGVAQLGFGLGSALGGTACAQAEADQRDPSEDTDAYQRCAEDFVDHDFSVRVEAGTPRSMPNVHHGLKELRFKIVYYGPGLGGKTTNLELIHRRTRPENRGKLIALNNEAERTLFFDLLPIDLGRYRDYAVRLHLCTVPGQIAHDETRKLVLRHVDGIVFVVDSQESRVSENAESIRNLAINLRAQGDDPATMPTVVQYNKRDLPTALGVQALRDALGIPAETLQIEATAKSGQGVFETLKAITSACLALVPDPTLAPAGHSPSILPGRRPSMFPDATPSGSVAIPRSAGVPTVDDPDPRD